MAAAGAGRGDQRRGTAGARQALEQAARLTGPGAAPAQRRLAAAGLDEPFPMGLILGLGVGAVVLVGMIGFTVAATREIQDEGGRCCCLGCAIWGGLSVCFAPALAAAGSGAFEIPLGLLLLGLVAFVAVLFQLLFRRRASLADTRDIVVSSAWRVGLPAAVGVGLVLLLDLPWVTQGVEQWFRWLFGHFTQPAPHHTATMVRLPLMCFCLALTACRAPVQGDPVVPFAHTNHLIDESSPYLLMHAHNPVDWYPWGDEAFARARAEQKPIFLSVGYATCYWCHVMERESFENEAIAAILNRDFICIKVDREERPDIDELYLTAVQLLTGQGGWPMSVWLTPELKPFFGGTYFPPDSRYGRPGFPDLLQRLATAWSDQRAEVEQQASQVADAVSQYAAGRATRTPVTRAAIQTAAQAILANQDPLNGGPQGSPKFPPDMACELLLKLFRETGDQAAAEYVTRALDQMAAGGLWDHLDGGFHRYSVDASWTVPHFEKMLYNQALLLSTYADAAVVLQRPDYARTAVRLADFVQRRLTDPKTGAFYSALDAETEAEEGRSYVWSRDELNQALEGQPEADLFRQLHGLDQPPNFEGNRYVLRLTEPLTDLALDKRLQPLRQHLLAIRDERTQPLRDDKVLTSWNALMISSLARAGDELGEPGMVAQADRAARFLLDNLRTADGGLLRVYRNGTAKQPGFLDDYAFLAEALLDLHAATADERWLTTAAELVEQMSQRFADPAGGFFYTAAGQADLFARSRNPQDNALPAGSSVAVEVLTRLADLQHDDAFRQQAVAAAEAVFGLAQQAPSGFAYLLRAAWDVAGDGPAVAAAPSAVDSASHVRLSARRMTGGVEAVLTIEEGWHLAAHGVAENVLAGMVLTVTGAEATAIEYPEGEPFAAAGQPAVAVYTGQVVIPISMAKSVAKLTITARVQACDDQVCLRPATLTVVVE